MKIPVLSALACLALAWGGCGGSDSSSNSPPESSATTTTTTVDAAEVGNVKPEIDVQSGETPPAELETTDLVTGAGLEAQAGSVVTVHYVMALHKNGEEVDSSWKRKPFSFELGAGTVTPGWEQGIEGMREGGRRELIAPSRLAYGKAGVPQQIGPDEALVYVIDLLEVSSPGGAGQGLLP